MEKYGRAGQAADDRVVRRRKDVISVTKARIEQKQTPNNV